MSNTAQIHEIYCMKDDELKKMVGFGDYLESLAEIHKLRKRVAELEAAIDVALDQHKRDGAISASVAYDLENLLCS